MSAAPYILGAIVVLSACGGCNVKEGPRKPHAKTGKQRPKVHFAEEIDVSTFQRGALHAHTTNSDGKASPAEVAVWYRSHGFNFLAITDHNVLTPIEPLQSLELADFILIPGEEITMYGEGALVHVNSLCTPSQIGPGFHMDKETQKAMHHETVAEALSWAVTRIRAKGGVALVDHPNLGWAFDTEDLPAAKEAQLLEIWSGNPHVHSEGNAENDSEEKIWDDAENEGLHFGAVAVDDAHTLDTLPKLAGPGRGWVQVFSKEVTTAAICDALAKGRLYASTGIELQRIQISGNRFSVWPKEGGTLVEFIAPGGKVISKHRPPFGTPAVFKLRAKGTSVRARVTGGRGAAWTQFYAPAK